jgi:S-formylglutathione hydrolase
MKVLKSHKCFDGLTEFYEHDSKYTKTKMKFSMHRPPESAPIKGGVIWLSGLTCTDENFITKAGAQRVLSELGLVIICPDTSPRGLDLPKEHDSYDFGSGAGFYVDSTTDGYRDHYNMYSYVNDEIYSLLNDKFNLKGQISIMGHSMGGHGALTIGLKNSDKYKSISAFAPIVNPISGGWGQRALNGYLGDDVNEWKKYDACELVLSGKKHDQAILIEQGLSDEFYPNQLLTKNFVEVCASENQKLKVNYRENYDHSYYFISTFIGDHLKYHHKILTSV